jgi:hypothetical protein
MRRSSKKPVLNRQLQKAELLILMGERTSNPPHIVVPPSLSTQLPTSENIIFRSYFSQSFLQIRKFYDAVCTLYQTFVMRLSRGSRGNWNIWLSRRNENWYSFFVRSYREMIIRQQYHTAFPKCNALASAGRSDSKVKKVNVHGYGKRAPRQVTICIYTYTV